jgi:2-phosphosulfolactate phosphatase
MPQVHITVGDEGCQTANRLRAIAIVVDALRASATIATLLGCGVGEVWVVAEVDDAWQLKRQMADALLVGERGSVKVDGFDFSNSPTEIAAAAERLRGRRVVFTSTTGAKRLLACRQAQAVLVGTTVNATAVAQVARVLAERFTAPIVIVAAGVVGRGVEWATEDIAAAWHIADRIGLPVGQAPDRPEGDLIAVFGASLHGRELLALGLDSDVRWCAQTDIVTAVPRVAAFVGKAARVVAN